MIFHYKPTILGYLHLWKAQIHTRIDMDIYHKKALPKDLLGPVVSSCDPENTHKETTPANSWI
jgi:hypothetical protein